MKFSESEFAINKDYEKILRNKIVRFRGGNKDPKVDTADVYQQLWSSAEYVFGIAQNEVVLNDLF